MFDLFSYLFPGMQPPPGMFGMSGPKPVAPPTPPASPLQVTVTPPPQPVSLGETLERADGSTITEQADSSSSDVRSSPELGWDKRLVAALQGIKAPPPPDVVTPRTPPLAQPAPVHGNLVNVINRAGMGVGNPAVPMPLGKLLGGGR